MNFYKEHDLQEYFDVSIIMCWYKKMKDFRRVFPKNERYFRRNGIEIVVVLDEDSEEAELKEYIDNYPLINWKIVVNRRPHAWRNPCKALNVGIRSASNTYVLMLDPETELFTDMVYQFRYMLEHYPKSFAVGNVIFAGHETVVDGDNLWSLEQMPYGSIMVEKTALETIGGYAEIYESWGCDDDNIRTRLQLAGWKKLIVRQAIAIHREDDSDGHKSRSNKSLNIPVERIKDALYPGKVVVNGGDWGKDFDEITFDWRADKSLTFRDELLGGFERFWVSSPEAFSREYRVIALLPTRNERKHVPDVLIHLDNYCDGIILLDDGSDDDTFEAAISKKLILKVKAAYKGYFDDLGNRNMLLRLAHLFRSSWFFFADADERFHAQPADFDEITNLTAVDVVVFKLIHLWDDDKHYRVDLEDGIEGVMGRFRMFRNKGFVQIISDKDVHFPAVPFQKKVFRSKILITNYGFMDADTRKRKYARYINRNTDRNQQMYDYEHLLDENPVLRSVEGLIERI
jgi:glycosyltransferase involved in cell wall biosynthesis